MPIYLALGPPVRLYFGPPCPKVWAPLCSRASLISSGVLVKSLVKPSQYKSHISTTPRRLSNVQKVIEMTKFFFFFTWLSSEAAASDCESCSMSSPRYTEIYAGSGLILYYRCRGMVWYLYLCSLWHNKYCQTVVVLG
jgi:hypothetical protein